jgi:hypothetical protein
VLVQRLERKIDTLEQRVEELEHEKSGNSTAVSPREGAEASSSAALRHEAKKRQPPLPTILPRAKRRRVLPPIFSTNNGTRLAQHNPGWYRGPRHPQQDFVPNPRLS